MPGRTRSIATRWSGLRAQGFIKYVAYSLVLLGQAAYRLGDIDQAAARFGESLPLARELGDPRRIGGCLAGLGLVAAGQGAWDRAARLLGATAALYDRSGPAPLRPLAGRV